MGRINVLDKHTAELIAAGEVVERPSSVIKELIENSIDAGARNITVEIKNGGTTFMRVTDDGCGFLCEDVKKAFLRHATSKVSNEQDLDSISTLGFRGEALASISAVARVELITKSKEEDTGSYYVISGGEEESFEETGCSNGSTIIIRDLFYNIPARQKFLKKDIAEGNAVALVVDRLALSHPEVSFTFIRDSKQVLKTAGDSKLYSAIYSVFGRDFANSLIDVEYELNGIRVVGFIARPEYAKSNRNMQTFFVNNRYVRSRTAGAAIDEAAKGSVMVGKFLSCVLNITIPFSAVDVNVHPAKIEVRFVNERPLFDAVYHAVKAALFKGDRRKEAFLSTPNVKSNPFAQFDLRSKNTKFFNATATVMTSAETKSFNPIEELNKPVDTARSQESVQRVTHIEAPKQGFVPFYKQDLKVADSKQVDNYLRNRDIINAAEKEKASIIPVITKSSETAFEKSETVSSETETVPQKSEETASSEEYLTLIPDDEISFRYIGEAFKTYIIIEINKELVFIDKHALHERIIYNQLKENPQENTQLLLIPESVVLNKTDYTSAVDNLDMFARCGFEVEDFGASTLLVRAAPQYICDEDIRDTITEMAGYITMNKRDINTDKMDWIFHNIACRAAIKAGNKSTDVELISLAKKMLSDDELRYCPHGRPTSVILKKSEVEKLFGRT